MTRALPLLLIVALAACEAGPPSPPAPKQASAAASVRDDSLVQALASDPELTTFADGLRQAGLIATLSSGGPYTLFAPTNAAFEAVPVATREALAQPEAQARLREMLAAHIVPARLTQAELAARAQAGGGEVRLPTAQGGSLTAAFVGGRWVLTGPRGGTATITDVEHPAPNGVVHRIDAVLGVN
jgi:uncharacterized surface protein with fasciclin (FAS1) repeats